MNQVAEMVVLVTVTAALIVAGYFFIATKATLLAHHMFPGRINENIAHIYWIYRFPWLIRLTDNNPVIKAILMFQYDRIVDTIVDELRGSRLREKNIAIISCAFGDVIPRIVGICKEEGSRPVAVSDIIGEQLSNAQRKLGAYSGAYTLEREDATALTYTDGTFDVAILFFLLHELPTQKKTAVIREAMRVLRQGGKLIIADFHRPTNSLLRLFGWLYFKTFEPHALEIWETGDPLRLVHEIAGQINARKTTYLWGNYQVVVVEKL